MLDRNERCARLHRQRRCHARHSLGRGCQRRTGAGRWSAQVTLGGLLRPVGLDHRLRSHFCDRDGEVGGGEEVKELEEK